MTDVTKFKVTDDKAQMGMAVSMSKEFQKEEDTPEDKAMLEKIFSSFDHEVGEQSTFNINSWGDRSLVGPTKSKGIDKLGKKYLRWKSKIVKDEEEIRDAKIVENSAIPSPLYPMIKERVKMIVCSFDSTCILTVSGRLRYMSIERNMGEYKEDISLTSRRVKYIAAGAYHFGAITEEPTLNLYMWGKNDKYQLGQGDTTKDIHAPERGQVRSLQGIRIVHIALGGKFTFAVTSLNVVYAWGDNSNQQLGMGSRDKKTGAWIPPEPGTMDVVKTPRRVQELNRQKTSGTEVVRIGDEKNEHFVQLMLSAGDKHAVSWTNVEQMNQFSEDFWDRYSFLKERINTLNYQIQSRDAQIEHLKNSNTGINTVVGTENADDLVDRRVTEDETLMMTGDMLTKLQEDLGLIVRRRQEIHKIVQVEEAKKKEVQDEVGLIERNIKVLWDNAEQLSYEYQALEEQDNKTLEMMKELEAKQVEMQGKQNLAKAAENTLIVESMKLNIFESKLEELAEEEMELSGQQKQLETKTRLVNKLYIQRDQFLRQKYLEQHQGDIFDMIDLVRTLWSKIKSTAVTSFTADMSEMERLTNLIGRRPGLQDIIDESDALLEQHIVQTDTELSKLIDAADARKDLADLLREILHDVIAMRHEINAYLSGILQQTSQRLERIFQKSLAIENEKKM
eukprot:g7221.t1